MNNWDTHICAEYIHSVFQRGSRAMEPVDFTPDWSDQPSKYKIYRNAERFHLPSSISASPQSLPQTIAQLMAGERYADTLSFEAFANCLFFAHGVLGQRLDVNWNPGHLFRCRLATATFARGTASGGGLYPTELYWACGRSGPLLSGLYHYDNAHHAMERLSTGDLTPQIQAAVAQHPLAQATDQFLLLGLHFWKNSFKYNSFGYHVTTQDLGALLASLRLLALGFQVDVPFLFCFYDEALNHLCGLETLSESIFAVIPLPTISHRESATVQSPAGNMTQPLSSVLPLPQDSLVQQEFYQRSKNVLSFPTIERVHQATLLEGGPYLKKGQAAIAQALPEKARGAQPIQLPQLAPMLLQNDLFTVFGRRRSSFGRFQRSKAFALVELASILSFGFAASTYRSDLGPELHGGHYTRLMVIVNKVRDIQSGIYAYDGVEHCLHVVQQEDVSERLQKYYFLRNYNLAEVGAVIVVVGKPYRMLEVYGNRGYRILNAEVGMAAQNIYLISEALSINCGATLGFENLPFNRLLGLEGTDDYSLLLLLVGPGSKENADFDARLF